MSSNYLMRSLMFVPGHNEQLLRKSATSEADVLLLDIEDSVQPRCNKILARQLIEKLHTDGIFANKKIFIRINDRESGELIDDILSMTISGIEGFVYPKSNNSEDIFFIDKLLESIEYKKKLEIGTFKLIPLIETSGAVLNALSIAKSSKRIVAIAYGCEDFLTDLQGTHDLEEMALQVPRSMIAMAARAAGVTPIDTVHIQVHDLEDLNKNLKIAKTLGFEGMLVLNPKEIPLVHQYFSPTDQEVEKAKEIVELAEASILSGVGVAIIKGKFVGPPLLQGAKKILNKNYLINNKGAIE
ncbi:CoA ester lyase [Malikia spinosa]|uniref:CoA ester lyase n=1 Tax=Malikia spinosa TaxID=86180 RepID=A0A2S9KD58_9BURK|nr:CoA ester lyase [Malikia spinosa]PRD68383.1 CoA ester lyase [Malikia spinosa]